MSPRRLFGLTLALQLLSAGAAQAGNALNYQLKIRPDFAAQSLQIEARVSRPDGGALPTLQVPPGMRLAVRSQEGLALRLVYEGRPERGLVWGEEYVYSAFDSCHWLPCPSGDLLQRATVEIELQLPEGYQSLASGQPLTAQRWLQSRPDPLYLAGFAAGRFTVVEAGPRLRYLGVGLDVEALRTRFAPTAAMQAFFEDKAGLPLPVPTYTQLLVPGGAAQEVGSYAVIGRAMLDPMLEDPSEDWVIAHELAHQWWGNLITCADWPEFWLNEGLTVFMTAAWKQQRWGEAAYRSELALARQRWQRAVDAGWDRPLSWPGDYPNLSTKRAIAYSKAALFVDALRQQLGEARFWQGIRRYTRDNAGRSVRAQDFQHAMESAAGHSLAESFARWVY